MDYTTVEKVKDYILLEIDEDYVDTIGDFITAMSRYMDRVTDRTLVAGVGSGEDTATRYYNGDGGTRLIIEDAWAIDEVAFGDQYGENFVAIEDTDFVKYPAIAPYKAIIIKNGHLPVGVQNVRITGDFGYLQDLPADLEFVCTVLVGGIIFNQTKGTQAKVSESIGNYSVSYATDKEIKDYTRAKEILDTYKKISF